MKTTTPTGRTMLCHLTGACKLDNMVIFKITMQTGEIKLRAPETTPPY